MKAIQLLMGGGEEMPVQDAGSLDSFRQTSADEQGLLLPFQAAQLLGISRQAVADLISRKRLRSWTFFDREYVSAKEVAERQVGEKCAGGRPRKVLQAA